MKLLLCHQQVSGQSSADERDVLDQLQTVQEALQALGHASRVLPCGLDLSVVTASVKAEPPDLVFNLVESLDDRGELIAVVPGLLSALGVRYTGASAEAMFLSSNKRLAKRELSRHGLPTPRAYPSAGVERYIVKSVWEHASRGMDAGSIVAEQAVASELQARERRFGGPFLAEEYVDGREFNVALLDGPEGPEVLPINEICFDGLAAGAPRIVDYAAKWEPDSPEYRGTERRVPAEGMDSPLLTELRRLSIAAWHAFELRGYARVDFRVSRAGAPLILEVNANPCLAPDAGFAAALARAQIPFTSAIARILDAALAA
jgi:D-alanine-D-alanine ligase